MAKRNVLKPFDQKPLILVAVLAAVAGVLLAGFSVFANYLTVAKHGTDAMLWFEMFVAVPACFALLAIPICLIMLIWQATRPLAIRALVVAVILFPSIIIGIRLGEEIRENAFHDLAIRSAPLIQAIEAYSKDHGSPPPNLTSLIPQYLTSIPGTGMGAYPEYRYELAGATPSYFGYNLYGSDWVLWVETPGGGINFDRFVYLPSQRYPVYDYGGVVQPIEDWAYVHE